MQRLRRGLVVAVVSLLVSGSIALAEPNAKAISLLRKALQEKEAGNFGAALKLYFDAHKEDPEILGLDDEGLVEGSTNWLRNELDADEKNIHAHFQMAELKMINGLERQALGHYEKVVSIDPSSSLAKLAKPLIDDLKFRVQGSATAGASTPSPVRPRGSSSGGGSSSSSSSDAQVASLQNQVSQLQGEVDRYKDEVRQLKQKLDNARQSSGAGSELDKLRKDFSDYKKEAEQWKLYKTLALSRGLDLGKLSGS